MRVAHCVAALALASCVPKEPRVWTQAETEQVRVRGEMEMHAISQLAASVQEMWDALASSVLPCAFTPSLGSLELTVLSDEAYELVAPPATDGYYGGSTFDEAIGGTGMVVVRNRLSRGARQLIQHEMGHRLVHQCMPGAPAWLNEGLASFIETADAGDGRLSIGIAPYWPAADAKAIQLLTYRGLLIHEVPLSDVPAPNELTKLSVEEFYAFADTGTSAKQRRVAHYAAAWSLVHFLELGAPDLLSKWHSYLGAIASGRQDPGSAWDAEFGTQTLQTRLASYLQQDALPYTDLKYEPRQHEAPACRMLSPAEVDLHLARMNWLSGSGADDTALLDRLVRAVGDPSTAVRTGLLQAVILLQAERLTDAEAALESVLMREPGQVHALPLLLEVRLQLSQQDEPPHPRPTLVRTVERLRQAPASAGRSIALARFELTFGDPSNASELSASTVQAWPRCARCWLVHAVALAATGRTASAVQAATRASNLLPETADRTGLIELLARINRD